LTGIKCCKSVKAIVTILTRKRRIHKKKAIPRRAGDIKAAVIRTLELSADPVPIAQIHSACEEFLGRPIKYDTIKDCVHKHSRGSAAMFTRTSHGRYLSIKRLGEPDQVPAAHSSAELSARGEAEFLESQEPVDARALGRLRSQQV
jgi:hypothetical protein